MTHIDRAIGLARSLATYHGIPFRQRGLRRLYGSFVKAGDLAFDIGAHAGNRVRALAALGCHVVAVEPQPAFAALLRRTIGRTPAVSVIEAAVADFVGTARLAVSDRTPTVSTLAARWREARAHDAEFAHVQWNREIEVATTTLDALIAQFGMPAFVKVDVEGAEPAVLAGLTQPVWALSFEYLTDALGDAQACAARLSELAVYEFNWVSGESSRLTSPRWLDRHELFADLSARGGRRHGDIYARRVVQ
jgi:FkbM family methyltransferase